MLIDLVIYNPRHLPLTTRRVLASLLLDLSLSLCWFALQPLFR